MHITVSGKQVELSDALQTRVSTQLETIANKYFDHALEAQVTFSRARSFFTCDINVHAGRGLSLRGEGEAADANTAFDDAAEHIAKRLRRYRRRVNDHHRDLAIAPGLNRPGSISCGRKPLPAKRMRSTAAPWMTPMPPLSPRRKPRLPSCRLVRR